MNSEFGDKFNHDPWAAEYDDDVQNETNPIRAGYSAVLDFVAAQTPQFAGAQILDIGIGTGNLSQRLSPAVQVTGLDLSREMMAIAREKLAGGPAVTFVENDMLAFWATNEVKFDGVMSTYVIHHLTQDEKGQLFTHIWQALKPGGRAAFGDLMFATAATRQAALDQYRAAGQADIAFDIEDEFFWLVDTTVAQLQTIGFKVQTRQFSDLSWVITADKR